MDIMFRLSGETVAQTGRAGKYPLTSTRCDGLTPIKIVKRTSVGSRSVISSTLSGPVGTETAHWISRIAWPIAEIAHGKTLHDNSLGAKANFTAPKPLENRA